MGIIHIYIDPQGYSRSFWRGLAGVLGLSGSVLWVVRISGFSWSTGSTWTRKVAKVMAPNL